MRNQFICCNMIMFLFLKDSFCSQIRELVLTPITSKSIDCTQGAQITPVHSTMPSLERTTRELILFPEIESVVQIPSSPKNVIILEATDLQSRNQSRSLQPKENVSPNKEIITELKKTAEQVDKAFIIESKDHSYIMMEAVNYSKTQNDELFAFFENLKYEPAQVPEFYDYFDVLGFIDKSIIRIQNFLETLNGDNIVNYFRIRGSITDKIDSELKKFDPLFDEVKKSSEAHKPSDKKLSEFDFIEDGLASIEARKDFIFKHYIKYRSFSYQDYLKAFYIKHNKLANLEAYLKKVRDVICPLCEEDIKKHAELFKTEFKRTVKEAYEKIIECHEKEKNVFNFLFDILNGLLKGIRECNEELEMFKNIFNNNGRTSRAE